MTRQAKPIRVCGDVAYVPLTKGYEAVIDAADVPLISAFSWRAHVQPHTVYAQRSDSSGQRNRNILMHRAIMNVPDELCIDHRDGDGLNNRRCNLRPTPPAGNQRNRRIAKNNTSKFKGVSFQKAFGKWRAYIRFNGKQRHLGFYDTPEDAHAAYCAASADLHGEFGRIA